MEGERRSKVEGLKCHETRLPLHLNRMLLEMGGGNCPITTKTIKPVVISL